MALRPDGTCVCHGKPLPIQKVCVWCKGPASPLQGRFLALLYPRQTSCDGCGRRQVSCTCRVAA